VEGLHKSVERFEEAILADESSAEAYAGLADAYSLLADYGLLSPTEAVRKARAAAERALELDPQSAEANVSLAFGARVARPISVHSTWIACCLSGTASVGLERSQDSIDPSVDFPDRGL
jgi:tetratricopeptide (TPR) repeat protein